MAQDPSAHGEKEDPAESASGGEPIPADAVDPELLRLPRPRLRRNPVLALAVVALGGLLLYRLSDDLRYALQPAAPAEIGDARKAVGSLVAGRFVALAGMPDLRNGLHFEAKGERARSQLFRLLGTQSRLLIVSGGLEERSDFQPRFAGRLRRFDELPYAASVRAYYLKEARVLRSLDLGRLKGLPRGALPQPLSMPDRAGEALTIAAAKELLLRVQFPDDVRVLLSRSKFPSEPDAGHEIERLGLPSGPAVPTKDGFGYVLRLPDGAARNEALSRIDAQGMLFQGRVEVYRVPLSLLSSGEGGLLVPGPEKLPQPVRYSPAADAPRHLVPSLAAPEVLLPWGALQAVQVSEPLTVPPDALVLVAGESPTALRWTLPVAALLLLFIGFNLWYLARSLTERRAT